MPYFPPPNAHPPDPNNAHCAHSTLEQLWESAVARYRKEHDKDETTLRIYQSIRSCESATAVSELVDGYSKDFAEFRGVGGKSKEVLGRLVKILLDFSDPSSSIARTAIPGGKFVIAAVTGLLKAVNTVSETYNAIERVLEEIKTGLESYESVLGSTAPISDTLSARIVPTLVAVLDFLGTVTTHCKVGISEMKRKWAHVFKERLKDFGAAILKDPKVSDKSRALDEAIKAEDKQMSTHKSFRDVVNTVYSLIRGREYREITAWIAPPEHSTTYTNHLDKKHEDTCNWILDEESFRDWKYRYASFYEILGKAGSGKSVLCSRIVEHLLDNTDDSPTFSLAYFFFDATIRTQRSHRALLSSILFQIACSSEACWERLRAEYNRFGRSGPPPVKKLSTMLADLLEISGPTCIVIDALDECQTANNDQINTLKLIVGLQKSELPAVHILVTSRPEHRITLHLEAVKEKVSLDLASSAMHYKDLAAYVSACLASPEYESLEWSPELREGVREILCSVEKSEGVFLWVELQLRMLCDTLPRNIRARLDILLPDLIQMFRNILDRYSGTLPIRHILGLIAVAEQPLTVQEVAAAFAFDSERGEVHESPPSHQIRNAKAFVLRYLPALVEIRSSQDEGDEWDEWQYLEEAAAGIETVHFIHSSVKEYLAGGIFSSPAEPPPQFLVDPSIATLHMATLSVLALTHSDLSPLQAFTPYAQKWWFNHVELAVRNGELDFLDHEGMNPRCPEAGSLNQALGSFFDHMGAQWETLSESEEFARRESHFRDIEALGHPRHHFLPPLHIAAGLGLSSHLKRLLLRYPTVDMQGRRPTSSKGEPWMSRIPTIDMTALFWTVSHVFCEAQLSTIDILLNRRAARTLALDASHYESLIHATQNAPNMDLVIGHLIARGVDIDARDSERRTSLHTAAARGDVKWLRTLLTHEADLNALDAEGKPPLMLPVRPNMFPVHVNVVRNLLEFGAQPDLCAPGNFTALQWATIYDETEAVNLLRLGGANTDALEELTNLGVRGRASEVMRRRLTELENTRRLRHAAGLPQLRLPEQKKMLHSPYELVGIPR